MNTCAAVVLMTQVVSVVNGQSQVNSVEELARALDQLHTTPLSFELTATEKTFLVEGPLPVHSLVMRTNLFLTRDSGRWKCQFGEHVITTRRDGSTYWVEGLRELIFQDDSMICATWKSPDLDPDPEQFKSLSGCLNFKNRGPSATAWIPGRLAIVFGQFPNTAFAISESLRKATVQMMSDSKNWQAEFLNDGWTVSLSVNKSNHHISKLVMALETQRAPEEWPSNAVNKIRIWPEPFRLQRLEFSNFLYDEVTQRCVGFDERTAVVGFDGGKCTYSTQVRVSDVELNPANTDKKRFEFTSKVPDGTIVSVIDDPDVDYQWQDGSVYMTLDLDLGDNIQSTDMFVTSNTRSNRVRWIVGIVSSLIVLLATAVIVYRRRNEF